jgi:molybdenum cofactor synthesis domain-containing protein
MTPPRLPRTAAALIIGNEILSGKVHEQNLVVLARALRALGISLKRVVMIADDIPTIAQEVRVLADTHDMVFTSGGVGPTHDDVTIQAVAAAFDTVAEISPAIQAMILAHFGDKASEGHLLMARVPQGCELIASDSIRWPTVKMHNVWVLPGVPEVFLLKLAVVTAHLSGGAPFVSRAVYTNLDEAFLVPLLNEVVAKFPGVEVGSYPKWNDPCYRTLLTFDGLDGSLVDAARDAFVRLLPEGEPQKLG